MEIELCRPIAVIDPPRIHRADQSAHCDDIAGIERRFVDIVLQTGDGVAILDLPLRMPQRADHPAQKHHRLLRRIVLYPQITRRETVPQHDCAYFDIGIGAQHAD